MWVCILNASCYTLNLFHSVIKNGREIVNSSSIFSTGWWLLLKSQSVNTSHTLSVECWLQQRLWKPWNFTFEVCFCKLVLNVWPGCSRVAAACQKYSQRNAVWHFVWGSGDAAAVVLLRSLRVCHEFQTKIRKKKKKVFQEGSNINFSSDFVKLPHCASI